MKLLIILIFFSNPIFASQKIKKAVKSGTLTNDMFFLFTKKRQLRDFFIR